MSALHAVVLSLLQGAFELFRVSSLGHTVIVPALLGWHEKQSDPSFLAFAVVLHLGTACALLLFFWRDWVRIVGALLRSVAERRPRRAAWLAARRRRYPAREGYADGAAYEEADGCDA